MSTTGLFTEFISIYSYNTSPLKMGFGPISRASKHCHAFGREQALLQD
jgi:hypothetical protein